VRPNIDGDVAALTTAVQRIMTGLKSAKAEDDCIAIIMKAAYGLVMRK
jgi:hypothetical protein